MESWFTGSTLSEYEFLNEMIDMIQLQVILQLNFYLDNSTSSTSIVSDIFYSSVAQSSGNCWLVKQGELSLGLFKKNIHINIYIIIIIIIIYYCKK